MYDEALINLQINEAVTDYFRLKIWLIEKLINSKGFSSFSHFLLMGTIKLSIHSLYYLRRPKRILTLVKEKDFRTLCFPCMLY